MRNKLKFLRRKHWIIKGVSLLIMILAVLLFIYGLKSSLIIKLASIVILVAAIILFLLALTTKTLRFRVGERRFYIVKGLFKHALTSKHHLLDETTTWWFGTHTLYYEFDKLEIEAKLGLFQKSRLFANGEEIERIK